MLGGDRRFEYVGFETLFKSSSRIQIRLVQYLMAALSHRFTVRYATMQSSTSSLKAKKQRRALNKIAGLGRDEARAAAAPVEGWDMPNILP